MRLRFDVFVLLYKPSEETGHFFQQKGCTFFLTRASIYTRHPWLTADLRYPSHPPRRNQAARQRFSRLYNLPEREEEKKQKRFPFQEVVNILCVLVNIFFLSLCIRHYTLSIKLLKLYL